MFSDKYKKDNEQVTPTPELKAYISKRLSSAESEVQEGKKDYFRTTFWRASTAVLALVLLVTTCYVGITHPIILTSKDNAVTAGTISAESLSGVKYSEIYESFKKVEQQMRQSGGVNYGVDTQEDLAYGNKTGTAKGDVTNEAAKPESMPDESSDYSKTNTQVDGVDEADIVKTDGQYIYSLVGGKIVITSADKGKLSKVSEISIENTNSSIGYSGATDMIYDGYGNANDMYVSGNRLAFIKMDNFYDTAKKVYEQKAMAYLYDITDKKTPKLIKKVGQSGNYVSSRLTDGVLYLFSDQYFYGEVIKDQPQTYVPVTYNGDKTVVMPEKDLCVFGGAIAQEYFVASSFKLDNGDLISTKSVLGGGNTIYANTDNVLAAAADNQGYRIMVGTAESTKSITSSGNTSTTTVTNTSKTKLIRLSVKDGIIKGEAFGSVAGTLLNQFSMDEYDGHFRLVTTVDSYVYYNKSGGDTHTDVSYDEPTKKEVSPNEVASDAVAPTDEATSEEISIEPATGGSASKPASTPAASGSVGTAGTASSSIALAPDIAWAGNNGSTNSLYVLDQDLKTVGKIENLAKGERVYSVRFTGNYGYFVTFRQVDPLFCVDLSNPKTPKVLSALKIPGFSDYLHPYSDGLLFGLGRDATETGHVNSMKLSMFDISNPANVIEKNKILVDSYYSEASYNHKAILINQQKDIIGFPGDQAYFIYGYSKDKGFYKRAELPLRTGNYGYNTRGLFIGNYFYVCETKDITSYALSDWTVIDHYVG